MPRVKSSVVTYHPSQKNLPILKRAVFCSVKFICKYCNAISIAIANDYCLLKMKIIFADEYCLLKTKKIFLAKNQKKIL